MENMRGRRGSGQGQLSRQMIFEEFQPSYDWTTDSLGRVLLVDLPGFKKEEVKLQVDNRGQITVSGESWVGENKRRRFSNIFQMPEETDIEKISAKFENGLLFVIVPKKQIESKEEAQKGGEKDYKEEEKPNNKATYKEEEKPNNKALSPRRNGDEHEKTTQQGRNAHTGEEKDTGKGLDLRDEKKGGMAERKGETSKVEEDLKEEIEKMYEEALENDLIQSVLEKVNKNMGIILTAVIAFSVGFYVSQKIRG